MFELSLALHSFVALLDIWHTIRLQLTSNVHHSTAEVVVALAPSLIDGLGQPLRNATTGQTRIRLEQAIIFVHQNWHYSSVIPCTSIRIDEGRSTVPNLGRTLLR